ncbi:MAG TPA: hypothetical protein PK335_01045 [Draconibacterium sp.]|nr:hypothetical protein [Draconibacterium sp.]
MYFYVLVGVCTELFNIVLTKLGSHNSLWISHIYFPLEFVLLAFFYIPHLAPVIKRQWIILIISTFVLYSIVNVLFIQSYNEFSQVRVYSSILLVLFSLIYFYRVMNEGKISKVWEEPMIWVNSSVMIIYSTIFFYNVLANLILAESRDKALLMSYIYSVAIVLFYLLVAIAFWMEGRQQVKRKGINLN